MHTSKKIIAFLLALFLVGSLSFMASAATITETTYYTVTKSSTTSTTMEVSDVKTAHVKGTADTIPYSVAEHIYVFDKSQFSNTYQDKLMEAYLAEGLLETLRVAAESGYKTVPAAAASGTYSVISIYTSGSGVWSVSHNNEPADESGVFTNAPISYTIVISLNR